MPELSECSKSLDGPGGSSALRSELEVSFETNKRGIDRDCRAEIVSAVMKSSFAVSVLALASSATSYWHNNLNYRSPSLNHPGLGVAVHKVNKRNTLNKRFGASQLNFTHGVASGDPYSDSVILWTRVAPMYDSVDSNVTVSGYVPLYWHGPKLVSTAPACVEYQVC